MAGRQLAKPSELLCQLLRSGGMNRSRAVFPRRARRVPTPETVEGNEPGTLEKLYGPATRVGVPATRVGVRACVQRASTSQS